MSIKYLDSLTLDIYIKKEFIQNVNFKEKESMEKYLKNLFKGLKDKYNIIIEGFYDITIYLDKYYGVILHLEKDDLDYYNYFKNQIDMKITTVENSFLYLVDDIPYDMLDKVNILVKDNNLFLEIKKQLTKLEMMKLLENSKIVYE